MKAMYLIVSSNFSVKLDLERNCLCEKKNFLKNTFCQILVKMLGREGAGNDYCIIVALKDDNFLVVIDVIACLNLLNFIC